MRAFGFVGEHITTSEVVAVKSHYRLAPEVQHGSIVGFDKVVHLIRCPFEAMVAERKRIISDTITYWNAHVMTPPLELFMNGKDTLYKDATAYMHSSALRWEAWVKSFGLPMWLDTTRRAAEYAAVAPVLTVRYEDLKQDTVGTMKRVLSFIGVCVVS